MCVCVCAHVFVIGWAHAHACVGACEGVCVCVGGGAAYERSLSAGMGW